MSMPKIRQKKSQSETPTSAEILPPSLLELENAVGHFMEYWGFKRIHGRIWAHLFTSQGPLDSTALMARLRVSKGLMSLALRDLLEHEVIKCDHVGRHGTTYYVANANLQEVVTNVLRKRESRMLEQAQRAVDGLSRLSSVELKRLGLDPERVQTVRRLVESSQILLSMFLSRPGPPDGAALFDQFILGGQSC